MRETKELLEIVLDEFDNERHMRCYSGICECIPILKGNNLITLAGKRFLIKFIKENRPKEGKHFDARYMNCAWFWEPYLKDQRIAWLKYLIEKESKK